jgi:hypothetical protein
MLQDADGDPVTAVGDSFVVHMIARHSTTFRWASTTSRSRSPSSSRTR